MFSEFDRKCMKLALSLARKGFPSSNPRVGAVLAKNGRILGKGYHKRAGMPHAEIEAIRDAGRKELKDATLYVTLEPCSHFGRTPPCTEAIINAEISRVVAAAKDPNPWIKGFEQLKKAGILVQTGLFETEAKKLNEPFFKHSKTGMPFVVLKSAASLDGKIACEGGDSKWITSEEARRYAHRLRAEYDAVLVGINTILKDNPHLTARVRGKNPLRIILDSRLRIPLDSNALSDSNAIVFTSERCSRKKKAQLETRGISTIIAGKNRVDFKKLLRTLGKRGIASVLIEGGGEVNASALEARMVDKTVFFISPKIIGGRKALTPVEGRGIKKMQNALRLRDVRIRNIGGGELMVEGYVDVQ